MEHNEPSVNSGYEHLRERAHEHLTSRDGRCHLHELIRFMFGTTSRPDLWRTLSETVLEGDPRLIRLADDTWALRSAVAEPSQFRDSASFVALDVETTGLHPGQHRVIEIGLARYQRGRLIEQYSQLINPDRRIPDYINKLTGLTDSDLIGAPRFGQIAPQVIEFVGDEVVVGHNIGFDLSFVNSELERCRAPALTNRAIDTLPLSMRLLKRTRRPSLDRVARELGLGPRDRHRALADAELAAEVALRLIAIANQDGLRFDELVADLDRQRGRRHGPGVAARSLLPRSHLERLPRQPGVYLMIDANDCVLYVGKAKSIRDRVASYYSQPLGYTRTMDGLAEAIQRIDHVETGSDLVAQLLEAQLIRRHQPPYNTVLRSSETYPYIRIDPANPWPYLRLVTRRRADGARYYGPFRQRSLARDVVVTLNRRFALRTCSRGFRTPASYGKPCLEYDLKRCPGPCIGRADSNDYRERVRALLDFLDGVGNELPSRLERQLAEASEALRFEIAKSLRHEIDQLHSLRLALDSVLELEQQRPKLIVQPGPQPGTHQVLMVAAGLWWSQLTIPSTGSPDLHLRLEASWSRFAASGGLGLDHNSIDESSIVRRWERTEGSARYVIEFDPGEPDVWRRLATRVVEVAMCPFPANSPPIDVVVYDIPVATSQ